jgi:hypothetical protein
MHAVKANWLSDSCSVWPACFALVDKVDSWTLVVDTQTKFGGSGASFVADARSWRRTRCALFLGSGDSSDPKAAGQMTH